MKRIRCTGCPTRYYQSSCLVPGLCGRCTYLTRVSLWIRAYAWAHQFNREQQP